MLAFIAACGGQPAAPTRPTPFSTQPATPISLRIEGPSSIAPGASVQYRAIASFADGRSEDVTAVATWTWRTAAPRTEGPVVLSASEGLITGGSLGEADLIAQHSVVSATIRVLVLPPGTFRVSGHVTELESGAPLSAHVAVVAGIGAGQATLARDSDGVYAVYGVVGAVAIEVSEESFQTERRTVIVADHQAADFNLRPQTGYDFVTGEWRMVVRAAQSCGSEIPHAATTRTFLASLKQHGSALTFAVSAPTIVPDAPYTLFGGVGPGRVDIYIQSFPDQTPPGHVLLEMLEPARFLGIAAAGRGVRNGDTVMGTLSGTFSVYQALGAIYRAPGTTLASSCRRLTDSPFPTNDTHTFRLDRN